MWAPVPIRVDIFNVSETLVWSGYGEGMELIKKAATLSLAWPSR
ncbi:hypothetical protein [Ornithinimicrobium sp.]|nr:hypothetical protein [Ornithinimicrobium sp.]